MIATILSSLLLSLRPFLGPATCRFEPTCTPYAVKQLRTESLHHAVWNILKRLISCRPF